MMRVVECVPNFSEGRDKAVLDAIAEAVRGVEGVELLDVDPGRATHRTVFTFVGAPEAVAEAAFRAVAVSAERIDMRRHRGEHPRIGAADVVPFVPLVGTTMQDCVELARATGRRIGDELGIPVYLYESAATRPERRNLADIRAGEYEKLEAKLKDPAWAPDGQSLSYLATSQGRQGVYRTKSGGRDLITDDPAVAYSGLWLDKASIITVTNQAATPHA